MPRRTQLFIKIITSAILFSLFSGCIGEIERNPLDDDTAPNLVSFFPGEEALNQPRNVRIDVTFDDPIVQTSCTSNSFYLVEAGVTNKKIAVQQYTLVQSNTRVLLYFSETLKANTSYRVVLENGPANPSTLAFTGKSWKFTTGDWTTNYMPQLVINSPTNRSFYNRDFRLECSALNANMIAYSVNSDKNWMEYSLPASGMWSSSLLTVAYSDLVFGTNKIYVKATANLGGLTMAVTNQIEVVVETNAPIVAINSPANNATIDGVVSFTGTAVDTHINYVEWRLDSGGWQKATGSSNWSVALDTRGMLDKGHLLSVRAVDYAGNISAVQSRTVVVDNWEVSHGNYYTASKEYATIWDWDDAFFLDPQGFLSTDAGGVLSICGDGSDFPLESGSVGYSINCAVKGSQLHCFSYHSGSLNYYRVSSWGVIAATNKGQPGSTEFNACLYNDIPYIAYIHNSTNLYLADMTGDSWNSSLLTSSTTNGTIHGLSILHDGNGYFWVAYILRKSSSSGQIRVVKIDQTTKQIVQHYLLSSASFIGSDDIDNNVSLSLASSGMPIAVYPNSTKQLGVARFTGSSWSVKSYPLTSTPRAIDSIYFNNELHLSFITGQTGLQYGVVTSSGEFKHNEIETVQTTKTEITAMGGKIYISANVGGKCTVIGAKW